MKNEPSNKTAAAGVPSTPTMTPTELLGLRVVLKDKLYECVHSGQATKALSIRKRIDVIDIMLDSILMNDMETVMPTIRIDLNMFTLAEIKVLLPNFDASKALMPGQTEMDFEVAEVVEEAPEEKPANPSPEITDESTMVEQLNEILKKDFVAQIPVAVDLFRKLTNSTDPDGVAWIKVSKLLKGVHKNLPLWYGRLRENLIDEGPIKAFYQVQKHLPTWSDIDIAILLHNALEEAMDTVATGKYESTRMSIDMILEKGPSDVKAYAEIDRNVDIIKSILGIPVGKKIEEDKLMKHLTSILNMCSPTKRAKILERKPYVEKGYPVI